MRVADDTATSVVGCDIQETVRYGAYCVRITYQNGSSAEAIVKTNFMENKAKGSVEILLNGLLAQTQNIAKIEIVIVYELYFYASWFDHHHTNWRCEYILNFV